LYAYNASILRENVDTPAILINGVEDHVHILCLLSRKFAIMDVIKESKTETTKWLKKQRRLCQDFQWQSGYGVFSVSLSNGDQEEHQKRMSFQDEFREMCKRHRIEIDERYVWD